MNTITLSIIMPLYNVESTIANAIDSILMQKVNFEYEIILVDDKSTDNTPLILELYKNNFPQIRIIKHKENMKNAMAFYSGISQAKGKFFTVLDGDDYYTVTNKLQLQVDFLNSDIYEEYTAVTHKFLWLNNEYNMQNTGLLSTKDEYTYADFLQNNFYFHTSTYMYRNIFKGNVPELFKEDAFRGDIPRTFFHLQKTKGKVKVLNFIGSVYTYNMNGIFSSLSQEEQKKRAAKTMSALFQQLDNEEEKNLMKPVINQLMRATALNQYEFIKREHFVHVFQDLVGQYKLLARNEPNFIFSSHLIDSFYESLSYIELNKKNISFTKQLRTYKDRFAISLTKMPDRNSIEYKTIVDIINKNKADIGFILFSNKDETKSPEIKEFCEEYPNLFYIFLNLEHNFTFLYDMVFNISAREIHHFVDNQFAITSSIIATHASKNICYYKDENFLVGLKNSSCNLSQTNLNSTEFIDISEFYTK